MPHLDEDVITKTFQGDLDDITRNFITAYSLRFRQEVGNLSSPLMRWLDFRFRYVDPQRRPVVFSDKFPKKDFPKDAKIGLKNLVRLIQKGKDINPYQGRGLTLRNDTSGHNNESRTDLLWADWNILHFHLSTVPIPSNQFFSLPADYLAFCIVGGNVVAFIDVLHHPDKEGFANPELMETVSRNWPQYLEQFQLKGIHADSKKSTSEIHTLRSKGVGYTLTFGDKAYMSPGMGLTTASTPLKLTIAYDRIREYVRALARMVCDPTGQFLSEIRALNISQPDFSLVITPQGLAIYEGVSMRAFLLPKTDKNKDSNILVELHNLIAPGWAVKFLLSKSPEFTSPYENENTPCTSLSR